MKWTKIGWWNSACGEGLVCRCSVGDAGQQRSVVFEITDKFCVGCGLTIMPFAVKCNPNDIFPVIASTADFYYHLRRMSSDRRLTVANMVKLECAELEEPGAWTHDPEAVLKANGENLILQEGFVNVVIGDRLYGFKAMNKSQLPLYAALFCFDMSDLSISL
jgi:hypothetical protein